MVDIAEDGSETRQSAWCLSKQELDGGALFYPADVYTRGPCADQDSPNMSREKWDQFSLVITDPRVVNLASHGYVLLSKAAIMSSGVR